MPTGVGEEAGLSDVCVCTCGWVFACIMRISRMCVKKIHMPAPLCVCAEYFTAKILTLTAQCRNTPA